MKRALIQVLFIVFYAPTQCLSCGTCSILVAGACCIAKPPNCCPNKPGECPTNVFGSADGPIPLVPFPAAHVITCSGDQNCSGNHKCCPLRQNSTGIIFYTCQEPFTEYSLGTSGLTSGCPARFSSNQQYGNFQNQGGIVNLG